VKIGEKTAVAVKNMCGKEKCQRKKTKYSKSALTEE